MGYKATKEKDKKMQKSTRPKNPGDARKWFLVDAKDQVLGRLAVVIANKLRAKDTPLFDPSVDAGAFVVVINAAELRRSFETDRVVIPPAELNRLVALMESCS